jgi:hypothetical protein
VRYALSGWCSFYAERRRHKDTQAAYDNLVVAHQGGLRREQALEARVKELERERNDAQLVLDTTRDDLEEATLRADALEATLLWTEAIGFGRVEPQ